ncbi:protein WVD2-like 7 isoform X2 [Andrographis paniculata]|uniref:protein WVD2-like 7 isoform X2 n=1 Tax=Andrographis paniculata TaxID=175694 RepID=UPI0021E92BB2|nr:protein WVD2-like 7 isoform X2 [Andrographis paniculata]
MSESVKSGGRLEVSVSFGRFDSDDLPWEKWSSFSPNKHLEEVGNLSTPGSVAQKKAYFEAHYKKIAARKTEELLEEEKSMDDADEGLSNGDSLGEVVEEVPTIYLSYSSFDDAVKDKNDGYGEGAVQVPTTCLIEVLSTEEEKQNPDDQLNDSSNKVDSELTGQNSSPQVSEKFLERDSGVEKSNSSEFDSLQVSEKALERDNVVEKSNSPKKTSFKISSGDVPNKVAQKRWGRAVVPAGKSSPVSTPRQVKVKPVSSSISASKSWQKKTNESAVPQGRKLVPGQTKRGADAGSLHMSMIFGPANSSTVTRKSLRMEKPKDKDIVKRGIRSSHNQTKAVPNNTQMQGLATSTGSKISTCLVHANENPGLRDDPEKIGAQRNQPGRGSNASSARSNKNSLPEKKMTAGFSQHIGLRSDERAEKRKEFLKNLEAKSIAREAQNAQVNAKSKEEKESELRKLRHSLNFKAKPLPSFYRVQRKAHLEKASNPWL